MSEKPYNLILGDAAKMPIASASIDLTVTSPPYDNLRNYSGFTFDFEAIARELFRVTKQGGVVVWVVGDQTVNGSETGTSFKQALFFKEIGFNLHDTMFYRKVGLTMNHNRYEQEIEYMFVFSKDRPATFNSIKIPCKWFGKDSDRTGQFTGVHNELNKKLRSSKPRENPKPFKIKGNLWEYSTGYLNSSADKIAFDHPAIFPEKLAEDHILSWSNEGDTVLDCFCGSGTTGKMAILNRRKFIGIDVSIEYLEKIAEARIEAALNKQPLFATA